jgi:hypothetical protein
MFGPTTGVTVEGNVWTYNRSDCRGEYLDLQQKGMQNDGFHNSYPSARFISFCGVPNKLGPIVEVC